MTTIVRQPAVAGTFYPDDPQVLGRMVDDLLAAASPEPAERAVAGVVAPHAGFVYSGPAAACAFRRVQGRPVRRVILLGCSHHFRFEGASIITGGEFVTPLGAFPVDTDFATALAEEFGNAGADPHRPEHALEVELPFLARTLGLIPIVPVLFGSQFGPWHERFADRLAAMTNETDLVVASSDLSHYLPHADANAVDRRTLDTLLQGDVSAFADAVAAGDCSVCSLAAVATAARHALIKRATSWNVLDYRTSGDTAGDRSSVVGYAAVSFEEDA